MATFKLASGLSLCSASSRYYLPTAKAPLPAQRGVRHAVLKQLRSCTCTAAEEGCCYISSFHLREHQINQKSLMVWLRASLGSLSESTISSILGTSRVHPFPLPSQEQHGDNFTLGVISSWAIPAQSSAVNVPSGISKK